MKPMLTIERVRAVKKADDTFAYFANKYGSSRSQIEPTAKDKELARKAAITLHDARLALLDMIGEKPTCEPKRRTYRHDPKHIKRRAIRLLRQVGWLTGSAESARRQFDRWVQSGKITHPLDSFARFVHECRQHFKYGGYEEYDRARNLLASTFPEFKSTIKRYF